MKKSTHYYVCSLLIIITIMFSIYIIHLNNIDRLKNEILSYIIIGVLVIITIFSCFKYNSRIDD